MAKISNDMLASLPRERDIASFSPGLGEKGRIFLLKFRLASGREEVIHLPPAVAFHVRDSIQDCITRFSYRDTRRRAGDSREETTVIARFLAGQPDFEKADWGSKPAGKPRVAIGCEVHCFPHAFFTAFQLGHETFLVYRYPAQLSFYLAEMINDAENDGKLVDLSRAPTASKSSN